MKEILGLTKEMSGNWYAPTEYLERQESVVMAELMNTCNSAGSWEGLFVYSDGDCYYVIAYSQENNYPRGGYTLFTEELPVATFSKMPQKEDLCRIYSRMIEEDTIARAGAMLSGIEGVEIIDNRANYGG